MFSAPVARRRAQAARLLLLVCGITPGPVQSQPHAPSLDPCTLVTRAELRTLGLPDTLRGVRDSTGVMCTWGSIDARHALVLKHYPTMVPATIERMRIAAARTGDPVLEPTVADGAWSMGESYGRVLMVPRKGQGVQLRYYVAPHSKGADRVDVRATEGDRQKLLAAARRTIARL